jgi:dihydroflavonol-4-reductase
MRYLVTGATGLIGTHVVRELVDNDHDVAALTRSRSNANHLPEEVTVVEGDITNRASIREPMTSVDGVFHIAAWFYTTPGSREVENAERINIEGTRNVLELMDDLDIPKGVYTSTIGVYPGTSGKTLDESIDPPTSDLVEVRAHEVAGSLRGCQTNDGGRLAAGHRPTKRRLRPSRRNVHGPVPELPEGRRSDDSP